MLKELKVFRAHKEYKVLKVIKVRRVLLVPVPKEHREIKVTKGIRVIKVSKVLLVPVLKEHREPKARRELKVLKVFKDRRGRKVVKELPVAYCLYSDVQEQSLLRTAITELPKSQIPQQGLFQARQSKGLSTSSTAIFPRSHPTRTAS